MFLFQNSRHFPDGVRRINHPGGIIGRIDDHRLGPGGDPGPELSEIGLKIDGIGRNHHQLTVVIGGIAPVFPEKGGKSDHFITGIEQGFKNNIDTPRRTHCHDDIILRKTGPEFSIDGGGDGGADIFMAGVVHITMDLHGIQVFQDLDDGLIYGCRCRHIGIAQTEIKDIFCAVDGCQPLAFFKHGPDNRTAPDQFLHFFRYHENQTFH